MPAGTETRTQKRRTYRTEREMKTLRYTYLVGLALTMLATLATGCQDDPLFSAPGYNGQGTTTRGDQEKQGALRMNASGEWYADNHRVPLVGAGRVVDNLSPGLVAAGTNDDFNNILDTNLDNYAEIQTGIDANVLGNQILSVKDLYRTYAPGQRVGFVISNGGTGSLLDASVLEFLVISAYRGGKLVESHKVGEGGELLNLGVLKSKTNTQQVLSVQMNESFDEIMLATTGVSAGVKWGGMRIYYAFVGETPEVDVLSTNFSEACFSEVVAMGDGLNLNNMDPILDPSHTDGVRFTSFILDSPYHSFKLNYKTTIEAGTEVGFRYYEAGVSGLNLLPTIELTPYDANGKEIENDKYEEKGLLGLSALGGGTGTYALIASKDITALKYVSWQVVGLDLGESKILRAYTRAPIKVDPTSYFTAPRNATTPSSSYYFMAPLADWEGKKGTLTASIVGGNPGSKASLTQTSDGGYALTGMLPGFSYTIEFTYTTKEGYWFTTTSTITRVGGDGKDCERKYLAGDGFSVVEANNVYGIQIITNMQDANNITNPNTEDYAIVSTTAGLLSAGTYAAVHSDELLNTEGRRVRVGFTIEPNSGLLGLQALKFFKIAAYNTAISTDTPVADGYSHSGSLVSLDIIHINNQPTTRVSIETDQAFDLLALQTVDIADVNLINGMKIYNAFYEDASCDTREVTEECSQLLTATTGVQIDYANTGFDGISVGASISNLGNIIDEDIDSCATVNMVANLGQFELAFKFDKEQQGGHWLRLLAKRPNGLLDAEVINTISVRTLKGENTQQTFNAKGGLIGLDLAGTSEPSYIEIYPAQPYDGVVFTFQSLASLVKTWQFYGLYGVKDLNGNGTPDCEEEETTTPQGSIQIEDLSACDANGTGVEFSPSVTLLNGIDPTATYYLEWSGEGKTGIIPVVIRTNTTPNRLIAASADQPLKLEKGYYTFRLYNGSKEEWGENNEHKDLYLVSNNAILTVHPNRTTWTGSQNNDWNNWSNWSDGSPWTCTDVIIPGGCPNYPVLTQSDYKNKQNYCANIYIKDGGQLVNSFYLNGYELAWVDIALEGGRYYMLSAPLTDMISGDWFISDKATAEAFESLNVITYPEQRINPTIYQRLWNSPAPVKNPEGYEAQNEVYPDETNWTPPYNALTEKYEVGMGFSLMAGKENGNYTFRFPKRHTVYHYYNLAGNPTGMTENVHSSDNKYGRFIYEEASRWNGNNELTVSLKNEHEDSPYYLAGNPFMAHIDIKNFMQVNQIKEVKVWNGTTNNSLILADGELLSATGNEISFIKPMEAFFVVSHTAGNQLDIKFNTNMLSIGDQRSRATTRTASAPSAHGPSLFLTAALDGTQARALLRVSPSASASVVPGEDTRLLLESEARPDVAVYTVADGQALDIQQVPADVDRIPLGFYLPDGDKADIRLTPEFTDPRWHDWWLVDLRTGQRQRLTKATLTLHDVANGTGQYALMKNEE